MSFRLRDISMNLNKSSWFYNRDEFLNNNSNNQIERDAAYSNRILSDEAVFKMSSTCFSDCVKSFDVPNLSDKEKNCLNDCKGGMKNIMRNLTLET